MSSKKISVNEAITLMKVGKLDNNYDVQFTDEKIEALDAMKMGFAGVDVPEELIYYDDESIDYSDIPALTDEELKQMKRVEPDNMYHQKEIEAYKNKQKREVIVDKNITDWAEKEKINISELASELLRDFYNKMKKFNNRAAF